MFLEKFKLLGFTENEAKVYSYLLSVGTALPSTIAMRTGLKRPNVYRVLEELYKKNYILKVKQKKGTFYTIDDVKKLYYLQREKTEIAEVLVKQLKDQTNASEPLEVTYYKGREGCVNLYNQILDLAPKEMVGWVNLDEFYKQINKEFDKTWTKKRIRKGIKVRLIMTKSESLKDFKREDIHSKRETRWLPKDKGFDTICFLFEGNILFFSTSTEATGIHIKSKELCKMQMQIFEMNWAQIGTSQ